uniref:Uncharacterized protein n=1 Tax=Glossina pallidipes TaxID=7398 RepID=A0A1B0AB45_GLOPL
MSPTTSSCVIYESYIYLSSCNLDTVPSPPHVLLPTRAIAKGEGSLEMKKQKFTTHIKSYFRSVSSWRCQSASNEIEHLYKLLSEEATSVLYRFVPAYGEVYDDCDNKPEMGGYSDFADVSETVVIADDEGIHFNGTVTIVWDVKETDRVTVRYHHEPFSVLVEIEALINMERRYRGVTTLRAYDENNRLKPNNKYVMFDEKHVHQLFVADNYYNDYKKMSTLLRRRPTVANKLLLPTVLFKIIEIAIQRHAQATCSSNAVNNDGGVDDNTQRT